MYSIGHTGYTQHTLQTCGNDSSEANIYDLGNANLTSVEPGSMPSLALSLAPLASWISLIFVPPFPMTEPMREFGIMNLIVTARLPGTEGLSKGSSLILRTIRPKALNDSVRTEMLRPVTAPHLGDCIQRPANVQNPLWVSRNALRDHNSGPALLSDLVYMRASLANNN